MGLGAFVPCCVSAALTDSVVSPHGGFAAYEKPANSCRVSRTLPCSVPHAPYGAERSRLRIHETWVSKPQAKSNDTTRANQTKSRPRQPRRPNQTRRRDPAKAANLPAHEADDFPSRSPAPSVDSHRHRHGACWCWCWCWGRLVRSYARVCGAQRCTRHKFILVAVSL